MSVARAVSPLILLLAVSVPANAQNSVFLEDLTWIEVRDAIRAGKTTALIPTGGTEQNGPHMVLGKHNFIVKFAAGEIAKRVGTILVAPVLAYVPEGAIDPPTGHMRFPGTITLPAEHFAAVVEFAARSLKAHGFLDIALIGDNGGNQAPLKGVAERLNKEWAATRVRVHHLDAYYDYQEGDFISWLRTQGEKQEDIGTHVGIPDTSQLLAIYPAGVRLDKLAPGRVDDGTGVVGNPTRANLEYGKKGLEFKVEAAIRQFRGLLDTSRRR
jgi:creatinine amidohydrolase